MTSSRTRNFVLLLSLTVLVAFSCKKPVPPPPPAAAAPPPPPPAPAPVITLRAEPATVERGQPTTLQWEARNAATVQVEPGLGQVAATGNRQVNPTSSVTYTATATGPGGTATDTARVTVNAPAPPPARPAPPRPAPTISMEELLRQNLQEVLFDYDKSEIRPDQVGKLQSGAGWLKQNGNVRIIIEGHADERGSEEYNLGLADRRANVVKEFLTAQGVAVGRINTVSYGEERPQCREQTESCFEKNRRAAFTLNQ